MKWANSFFLLILMMLSSSGYCQYVTNTSLADGKILGIADAEIPTTHLQLWLRADTGVVANGSRVSRWLDQSGNRNDAIEADTSRQPVLVNDGIAGKPLIRFDGVNDRLGFTGTKPMTQISLFIVFNNRSGATGSSVPGFILTFGPGDAFSGNQHFAIKMRGMDNGDDDIIVGTEDHTDYVKATGQGIAAYDSWRNISITRDKSIWNTTLRWNGIDAPTSTSGVNLSITVPLGDLTASGGGIGSTDNFPDLGTVLAKCDIAEIAVYDTVFADSIRLSIERYLSNKYNPGLSSAVEPENPPIAESFRLFQNYPNPFNPSTQIHYTVGGARGSGLGTWVKLAVYDLLGREVALLVDERKEPGSYDARFDASHLATGVYLYRLTAGSFTATRKLLLLK